MQQQAADEDEVECAELLAARVVDGRVTPIDLDAERLAGNCERAPTAVKVGLRFDAVCLGRAAGPIPRAGVRQIYRDNVATALRHLDRPEAIAGADVEATLTA